MNKGGDFGDLEQQGRMPTAGITIHIMESLLLITNLDALEQLRAYKIHTHEH